MAFPLLQVEALTDVEAFTDRLLSGNPAAVCIGAEDGDDRWMPSVAAERNLSETASLREEGDGYRLRWFTHTWAVKS